MLGILLESISFFSNPKHEEGTENRTSCDTSYPYRKLCFQSAVVVSGFIFDSRHHHSRSQSSRCQEYWKICTTHILILSIKVDYKMWLLLWFGCDIVSIYIFLLCTHVIRMRYCTWTMSFMKYFKQKYHTQWHSEESGLFLRKYCERTSLWIMMPLLLAPPKYQQLCQLSTVQYNCVLVCPDTKKQLYSQIINEHQLLTKRMMKWRNTMLSHNRADFYFPTLDNVTDRSIKGPRWASITVVHASPFNTSHLVWIITHK